MKFSSEKGLSITHGGAEVMAGIRFWVCPEGAEPIYLPLAALTGERAEFSDESGEITGALWIVEAEGGLAALYIEVSYYPSLGSRRGQNHLDIERAAGIDIAEMPFEKAMANYMRCNFWCGTKICGSAAELPERTQALLARLHGGGYMLLFATSDGGFKSNLKGAGGGTLFAYSHYPQNRISSCVMLFGFDEDPYRLPERVAEFGIKAMKKPIKPKKERRYPEVFEYLGWCSWDAFHMDVSHEGLLAKAREFAEKGIPVRWMLLDDMWADCPNNNLATMHSRELKSFEADHARFPGGLRAAIAELKGKYGLMVGVWHPTTGYWHGIDPEGQVAEKYRDQLAVVPNGKLLPYPSFERMFGFYYGFHRFLRECGADFVKVDNQSFLYEHYRGMAPIGRAAEALHEAVEASVGVNFGGAMINCMGMAIENFWSRPQSSVLRISGDFLPENRKWFAQHLIQCSFNAFVYGGVYTGDWDMWWSDDGQARKNAVLRAMSGGPVYLSDELGRSIPDVILPLCYRDGRIIRLKTPAVPSPDCILEDPEQSGKIFKVANTAGCAGIVAAFNLDEKERPVSSPRPRAGFCSFTAGTRARLLKMSKP